MTLDGGSGASAVIQMSLRDDDRGDDSHVARCRTRGAAIIALDC